MTADGDRGPVTGTERIVTLDVIRGVAILGILVMNALSFGLVPAAYFNVSAGGVDQPLDWVIGVVTMVLVDQKMMALFSLLFGVGVVVFADRASAKGHRSALLSLWRFALLFVVGVVHISFWDGDVLVLYALCAPIVLLCRRLPAWLLGGAGLVLALVGTAVAPLFQGNVGRDPAALGGFWFADYDAMSTTAEQWFIINAVGRALGLMFIGVALYRLGVVQGSRDDRFYRRLALWGLGTGTAVTAMGIGWHIVSDWSAENAFTGTIPTGLGTVPMALGYMACIILWTRTGSRHLARFASTGQMALSNYLTQTILGLVTLGWALGGVDLTRSWILLWIVGVWIVQLWWSPWWLARFHYGPFEWAWRCATYRRWQPLRRRT